MVGHLKINAAGPKACKVSLSPPRSCAPTNDQLCHGPLTSPVTVPTSPAMQSTASRMGSSIPTSVDCHSHVCSLIPSHGSKLMYSACHSPAPGV